MIPEATPICIPQVDWRAALQISGELLSQPPTRKMDAFGIATDNLRGYLAWLSLFGNPNQQTPDNAVIDSRIAQAHVMLSFLIHAETDTITYVREKTRLVFVSRWTRQETKLAVASGTLDIWFDSIIIMCTRHSPRDVRLLGNKIMLGFEAVGLSRLWEYTRKIATGDGTFHLENKQ